MSNRYIHYDLHRLVEKYFDNRNIHPMVTENDNRSINIYNSLSLSKMRAIRKYLKHKLLEENSDGEDIY